MAPTTLDNGSHLINCGPSHDPASAEQVGTPGQFRQDPQRLLQPGLTGALQL